MAPSRISSRTRLKLGIACRCMPTCVASLDFFFIQVARTTRVHSQVRLGKSCHQLTGTACVIQMHVGEDDVVHLLGRDALCRKGRYHVRCRVRGPGVDNRGAALLYDQMDRGLLPAVVDAVDGADAVAVVEHSFRGCHRGHYRIRAP